ncbi:MAG: citramalate synthase [Elusimicrobiota bacterium]|nr:citramalate synthase [Elusimicrobiota bacterium]
MKKVLIYDTTLRDGTQGEGISFSVEDKLKIAKRLDDLGIHYIEGGWPGSNPKDILFFKKAKNLRLRNAKIVAFGATRYKGKGVSQDPNLNGIVKLKPQAACIFGKSWGLHVKYALGTTLGENLKMIFDSVKYLKAKGMEIIYDAEHFFDGYIDDHFYAMDTLRQAAKAGADNITLCDTNGGMMPHQVESIVKEVKKEIKIPLGIHTHNDSEMAVANSVVAVRAGCVLVQGTINGYGERCGNANLSSIIPNLRLKLGIDCISDKRLESLTEVSRYVSEIANMIPRDNQPYVGNSAFAHKGGVHVSAMAKHTRTYEHVSPEKVGNRRRILVSELSGRSSMLSKAKEFKIDFREKSKEVKDLLQKVKQMESQGYQFEGAEGSFELLMKKTIGKHKTFFDLEGFRVIVEKDEKGKLRSEATIKVMVGGKEEHTASEGDGPVNALDNALRKALERFYPELKSMSLTDFKVRVIDATEGTAAKVRVLIESRDERDEWGTVGVSENIIEASWQALVDSIEYKLLKEE